MGDAIFLETASQIARRLCQSAVWQENRCRWIGLTPVDITGGYKHLERPLGPDLYCGAAGNLYFLGRLFRLTAEPQLKLTAEGAAREALARKDEFQPPVRMSFYYGQVGIAFALVECGEAFGDDQWIKQGLRLLKVLSRRTQRGLANDFLLGIAGAVPALLNLYDRYPEEWLLAFACRLGDDLLKQAKRRDIGWSWEAFGPLTPYHIDDLTGLAHGASGVAFALLELYGVTANATYREAAEEGFRYERHWFREESENWLDLRFVPGPDGKNHNNGRTFQIQWCYGAVGAGLTRLRAYRLLGRAHYLHEAEAALRTTQRDLARFPNNWQPNYSLCHGLAGNAEILLEASALLNREDLRVAAEQVGWQGIELYEKPQRPWPSALNKNEIPALMTGVAGTAYFYLRLYDAERTPSILLVTSQRLNTMVSTEGERSARDS
ncbi:MAG: lanthionine synthetase LanC family protein [Blastocatellia bacterium]